MRYFIKRFLFRSEYRAAQKIFTVLIKKVTQQQQTKKEPPIDIIYKQIETKGQTTGRQTNSLTIFLITLFSEFRTKKTLLPTSAYLVIIFHLICWPWPRSILKLNAWTGIGQKLPNKARTTLDDFTIQLGFYWGQHYGRQNNSAETISEDILPSGR